MTTNITSKIIILTKERCPVILMSTLRKVLGLKMGQTKYLATKHGEELIKQGCGKRLSMYEQKQIRETNHPDLTRGSAAPWVVSLNGLAVISPTLEGKYLKTPKQGRILDALIKEMISLSKKELGTVVYKFNPKTTAEATHRLSSGAVKVPTRTPITLKKASKVILGKAFHNFDVYTDTQALLGDLGFCGKESVLLALRASCTKEQFDTIKRVVERSNAALHPEHCFNYAVGQKQENFRNITDIARKTGNTVEVVRQALLKAGVIEKNPTPHILGRPAYTIVGDRDSDIHYLTTVVKKGKLKEETKSPVAIYAKFPTQDLSIIQYIVYDIEFVKTLLPKKKKVIKVKG